MLHNKDASSDRIRTNIKTTKSSSAAPPDTKRSPSEVVVVPAGGEPDVEKLDDAQDQRRGAISAEQQAEQPSQLLDVKFLLLNCARAVPTNEVDDHLVLETLERCDLDAHLLLELVAKAKYEFHEAEWSSISDGAKDLISKLLVVDPLQRLTMQQLLDHSWLKGSVAAAKASIEAAKKGGSKKGSSKAAGAPSAMVSAAQRTADGVAAEKPGELNPTVLQPGGGSKKGACCVIS